MDMNEFYKQWPELKQRIQLQHPELTEEDLSYELGKEAELLERLRAKLGKTKDEIRNWLHLMG